MGRGTYRWWRRELGSPPGPVACGFAAGERGVLCSNRPVAEVLPLVELLVEQGGVVDDPRGKDWAQASTSWAYSTPVSQGFWHFPEALLGNGSVDGSSQGSGRGDHALHPPAVREVSARWRPLTARRRTAPARPARSRSSADRARSDPRLACWWTGRAAGRIA